MFEDTKARRGRRHEDGVRRVAGAGLFTGERQAAAGRRVAGVRSFTGEGQAAAGRRDPGRRVGRERTLVGSSQLATILGVVAMAAALGAPGPLRAQQVSRAEVAARIDSLLPRYHAAQAAVRRRDSLQALGIGDVPEALDTVTVGPFRVIAFPDQAGLAARVFETAWARWEPLAGDASRALQGHAFLFDYGTVRRNMGTAGPLDARVHINPRWFGPEGLDGVAERALVGVLQGTLPASLEAWAPLEPPPTPGELRDAYRALASSASPAARTCLSDGGPVCWEAVGATGGTRAPAGDGPVAAPRSVRATLLGSALELGGAGALERLLGADTSAIPVRLAAAAGVPPDSLMAAWRARVMAARPEPAAGLLRVGSTTILWALVLALFAMRSTRWRSV